MKSKLYLYHSQNINLNDIKSVISKELGLSVKDMEFEQDKNSIKFIFDGEFELDSKITLTEASNTEKCILIESYNSWEAVDLYELMEQLIFDKQLNTFKNDIKFSQ